VYTIDVSYTFLAYMHMHVDTNLVGMVSCQGQSPFVVPLQSYREAVTSCKCGSQCSNNGLAAPAFVIITAVNKNCPPNPAACTYEDRGDTCNDQSGLPCAAGFCSLNVDRKNAYCAIQPIFTCSDATDCSSDSECKEGSKCQLSCCESPKCYVLSRAK
jgi:hypothetical protein